MNSDHPIMHVADVGAAGVALAALLQWLPAISALLSIIWLVLRIAESRLMQKWFRSMGWTWLTMETPDENQQKDLRR